MVIIDFVCRVLIMYDFFSGFILMTYFRKNFYFCMLRDFISFAFYIICMYILHNGSCHLLASSDERIIRVVSSADMGSVSHRLCLQ